MLYTSREIAFRRWMMFSGALYALATLGFALYPLVLGNYLGETTQATISTTAATNPMVMVETASFVWNTLAVGMMAAVAACAFRAWKNPAEAAGYAMIVVVAGLAASGMAILTLLLEPGDTAHTAPIAVAAVELPLALVTLWTYTMARRSRAAAEREAEVSGASA